MMSPTVSPPPPVALMEWWLYSEDMTEWVLFRETECGGIDAIEHRIMENNSIEDLSCTLERVPHGNTQMSINVAQEHWMDLVRKGFRRLTDGLGVIETQDPPYQSCWLTLNRVRDRYKNT